VTFRRALQWLLLALLLLAACSEPAATEMPGFSAPGAASNPEAPVAPAPTAQPAGLGVGAVAFYDFDVGLDYLGNRAQVTQLLEIVNPGPDSWERVVFFLPFDLQSERFTLSRISLLQQVETAARNITLGDDGFLTITLPDTLAPNAAVSVNIIYGLEAEQTLSTSRRPFGDVGYNGRVLQFANWYPQLVPYIPGRGWQTWEPTDVGPPLFSEAINPVP